LTTFTDHRHPSIADFPIADCRLLGQTTAGFQQRGSDRACLTIHRKPPRALRPTRTPTDRSLINVVHRRKRCSTTPPLRKDTLAGNDGEVTAAAAGRRRGFDPCRPQARPTEISLFLNLNSFTCQRAALQQIRLIGFSEAKHRADPDRL
jgi:hypothetical protein